MNKIRLREKIAEIAGRPYFPIEVSKFNDQVARVALFDGEFHWHQHEEDELFFVYEGEIEVQFKEKENVRVKEGEFFVVPKKVEHCPKGVVPSYVIFFESSSTNPKGD
ncbi:MAG: mannose-6-phosphate isomerase [Nanoarchaeota archaeon]|nr:mannose-6-phosphate isomerase [Nanoarchaeota archaeon]|tara:strand:+ start:1679 stop:2002 length:324 start_codon:yes stop_codon:yes gene_type:complete